jgi:hypothetical protein
LTSDAGTRLSNAPKRDYDVVICSRASLNHTRTSLYISFEENGEEHFAVVPLLMVTAAVVKEN